MLLKICPRCKQIMPHGKVYCASCAPIVAEQLAKKREEDVRLQNRRYNRQRRTEDPKYSKFRNSKEWRTTSRAKLEECEYKCEARLPGCQIIACEVHHKTPIKTPEGWEKRFDWNGLQGVCIACHNVLDGKTTRKREPNAIDIAKVAAALHTG